MLATVINALALQDALEKRGVPHPRAVRHRDARGGRAVHPPPRHPPPREGPRRDLRRRHRQPVLHHRHRGRACARWRSAPRSILKATKVDGIYTADPDARTRRGAAADGSTYIDVLNRGLEVMDATAISLCMDNKLPIVVFDLDRAATSGGSSSASRWARWCPPSRGAPRVSDAEPRSRTWRRGCRRRKQDATEPEQEEEEIQRPTVLDIHGSMFYAGAQTVARLLPAPEGSVRRS